jgi:hypothetical protein
VTVGPAEIVVLIAASIVTLILVRRLVRRGN